MALKTIVKVGNINNLSDARYCSGMMVDILGFNINENAPEKIELAKYQEITGWLAGVKYLIEYDGSSVDYLEKCLEDYEASYFQLSNFDLAKNSHSKKELVFKIDLNKTSDLASIENILEELQAKASYFILEDSSESKTVNEISEILKLSEKYSILLGTGINAENVNNILENNSITGITLKGGDEIKPGFKDYDELADILEAIEIED